MKKQIISVFLALMMVLSLLPTTALAVEPEDVSGAPAEAEFSAEPVDQPGEETEAEPPAEPDAQPDGEDVPDVPGEEEGTEGSLAPRMALAGGEGDGPEPVAQIGDDKYYTLAEAIAAVQNEEAITLLSDVELISTISVSKKLTIDLAGHTITTPDVAADPGQSVNGTTIFSLENGADLTIKDSVGGGKVVPGSVTNSNSYNADKPAIGLEGSAKLTVDNAAVEGFRAINGRYAGGAIETSSSFTGTIEIKNGAVIRGGDNEKSGITVHNYNNFNCKT